MLVLVCLLLVLFVLCDVCYCVDLPVGLPFVLTLFVNLIALGLLPGYLDLPVDFIGLWFMVLFYFVCFMVGYML